MVGQLITLPLRVGVRSAQLCARTASGAAGLAFAIAGRAVETVAPSRPSPVVPTRPAPVRPSQMPEETVSPIDVEHPPTSEQARPLASEPPPPARRDPTGPPPPARPEPIIAEPAHVSEEPVLVREEAETGAEDGAGAEVTVLEPWKDYARMGARDVIVRARSATPAELAAVRLYEASHRSRQTVLDAVDRQLKRLNGNGRPA
jgi:hypothetical protein